MIDGHAMACEPIVIDGQSVTTLKELLRPGLRAVIVGVNPGLKSVRLGHYWQGRDGKEMWRRLTEYRILDNLRPEQEDDDAFAQGIGFADLIRRPSKSSGDFTDRQLRDAVPDLLRRLSDVGKVPVIFRYKTPFRLVGDQLRQAGHEVLRIPSPPRVKEHASPAQLMRAIQHRIGAKR
jgi:G:T/U-mismatch repair DNA glycosylase